MPYATGNRWRFVVYKMEKYIKVRGARQHNLKSVNLDIPKNKLVVFTGVSGSGKSSMAFDTVYAEGQRKYVESLSTYARQFLGVMEKPDMDLIEGLSPAISIDQKTTSRNPRSTVGTVTEVYDYMRLLFARIGHPHCPVCGREISRQSVDQIVDSFLALTEDTLKTKKTVKYIIFSPVVVDRKGEFTPLFSNLKAKGFKQVRVDGVIKDLSEDFVLLKTNKHTIEVVMDKLSFSKKDISDKVFLSSLKERLSDSVQQSLDLSDGLIIISEILDRSFELPDYPKKFGDHLFSERFACPIDNIQIAEIEPRTFSFNSPHGACSQCSGLGKILKVDENLLFSKEISITEGGILPFKNMIEHDTWYSRLILTVCEEKGINPRVPIKNLNEKQKNILLYGIADEEFKVEGTNRFGRQTYIYEVFTGIIAELERRYKNTESDWVRHEVERYMRESICPKCDGARLKEEALGVTIDNLSIANISSLSIDEAISWIKDISKNKKVLTERESEIAKLILKEIDTRLNFLLSVGLEYLTLDRGASTLSGGEAQRIRLASQIGSGLTGVLYVLDEPTIGLHQRDNDRLISTLKHLKNLGNTVLVVEHDSEMMKKSDHIIDFGPGAGKFGGEVIAKGSIKDIKSNKKSLTGKYLSGKKKIEGNTSLQIPLETMQIKFTGIKHNNLNNVSVKIPLGRFVVITGVSGSGKSSLLVETVYPAIKNELNYQSKEETGIYKNVEGIENVDKIIMIDQSPIGRTPRSNPATYTKVFDLIRDVYALTKDAKTQGFKKSRFSFNLKGGRCEACEGQGQIKIEMQFMSDLWVKCDVCGGKRYNAQTLEVDYKGKNISEILDMNVSDAIEFFHNHANIVKKLETLESVGLGYIELGQPATTLSGGEAQRVKLSSELTKKDTGNTFYILDEPTTGLHFYDLEKLLKVLKLLVSKGNTVAVIEHNLDVIKNANWIIDLGPEGGDKGGKIIAEGAPKDIVRNKSSFTGAYLKEHISL